MNVIKVIKAKTNVSKYHPLVSPFSKDCGITSRWSDTNNFHVYFLTIIPKAGVINRICFAHIINIDHPKPIKTAIKAIPRLYTITQMSKINQTRNFIHISIILKPGCWVSQKPLNPTS
jgi:hypothetical protein